jgi:uncharacterized NAD(P)/FAD-binding protein YdhS
MTTSSFIFSQLQKVQSNLDDIVVVVVGAQLAIKLNLQIDYPEVFRHIYKKLVNALNTISELQEQLNEQSEEERKILDRVLQLGKELELINEGDKNGC